MSWILKVARFLRIVDGDDHLSLTNLAVMIALFKLALTPTVSMTDTGALVIALANYVHRRQTVSGQLDTEDKLTEEVRGIEQRFVEQKVRFEEQTKQIGVETDKRLSELKDQISKLNFAVGVRSLKPNPS